MVGMMARDFEGWMAKQERDTKRAMRAPIAIVNNAIEIVRGEMAELGTRKPTAPIELTYQTANYISGAGYPAVRFIMDFPDVTMGTDGQPITVNQYEVWGRDITPGLLGITTSAAPGLAAPGLTAPGLANTFAQQQAENAQRDTKWLLMATSAESGFRVDDFVPMSVWEFKARAISPSSSVPGNFSAVVTVVMQKDTTPPPQPTAPNVISDRGVLRVSWDGQSVSGSMPADFSYAILAQGGDAVPEFEVARFGRVGGVYIATGLEYYDPQFFRVKAFDESGNEGPWSAVATGFTSPLVDEDVILSEIDAAQTLIKNIDGGVSIKDGTIATQHLYVTEDMTAKLAQFLHVKAVNIDANELWADEAFFGVADAYLVRSDMFVGKQFEGGMFTTTLGGRFQTNVEDLRGIKMRESGIYAWNSTSGEQTYALDSATGNMVATGIFQTSIAGQRVMLWDHGDGISAMDMFPDASDQHGAVFSQPVSGGGYSTNIQHYTNLGAYSAYMILYSDGNWSLGQFTASTGGSYIAGGGTSGDIFLEARGTGTSKNINIQTNGGYAYLHAMGTNPANANVFIKSDVGTVSVESAVNLTLNGNSGNIKFAGKMPVAGLGITNATFYLWITGIVSGVTGYAWTVNYSSPVPSGLRRVFVTPEGNDYVSFSINTQSASGFKANHKPEGAAPLGASTALQFLGIWVDQ
jgi:hypothetical protein